LFLSKNKSTPNSSSKKPTTAPPTKKLTPAQSKRLQTVLATMPPIEKLDPKMYAKLQSAIKDAVAKALPEYQQWVDKTMAMDDCPTPLCSSCGNDCPTPLCSSCGNDCPTPLCSSCGNDCPTPMSYVDEIVSSAVNEAMIGAIRQALKDQYK
jgi:hypothetical protein